MINQLLIVDQKHRADYLDWLIRINGTPACGDCTAIYQLLGTDRDGMIHFNITHDETCPWLSAAEEEAERS